MTSPDKMMQNTQCLRGTYFAKYDSAWVTRP